MPASSSYQKRISGIRLNGENEHYSENHHPLNGRNVSSVFAKSLNLMSQAPYKFSMEQFNLTRQYPRNIKKNCKNTERSRNRTPDPHKHHLYEAVFLQLSCIIGVCEILCDCVLLWLGVPTRVVQEFCENGRSIPLFEGWIFDSRSGSDICPPDIRLRHFPCQFVKHPLLLVTERSASENSSTSLIMQLHVTFFPSDDVISHRGHWDTFTELLQSCRTYDSRSFVVVVHVFRRFCLRSSPRVSFDVTYILCACDAPVTRLWVTRL